MMALLFNLVSYSDAGTRPRSPILISLIICLSYFSTSFINFSIYSYVAYAIADVLTMLLILWIYHGKGHIPALYYCVVGLSLNALLHIAMLVDFFIFNNDEPWLLWSVYSIGINFNDAMMIIVLIVNRDFLGLCRAGNYLKTIFQRDA